MKERTHTTPRGLDAWVEIFRAGRQTAGNGTEIEFSTADLDQIIDSHAAGWRAPLVIGHPKHNDPAYGWVESLKRDGDSLFAKFRDITPEFAAAVEAGHYSSRSVRLVKDKGRWLIDHVGFLGAKRPAIPLAPLNYEAPQGEIFDFSTGSARALEMIARGFRRLRELLIDKFDRETADAALSEWELEEIARLAADEYTVQPNQFTAPGADAMSFTQEDIDAAKAAGRAEAETAAQAEQMRLSNQLASERRERRNAEFQAHYNRLVDAGHAPAKLSGFMDFMHAIDALENATFEFSAADGTKKTGQLVQWFIDFASAMPPDVTPGKTDTGAGADSIIDTSDAEAIARAAADFQAAEERAGRTISVSAAVAHVMKGKTA